MLSNHIYIISKPKLIFNKYLGENTDAYIIDINNYK